MTNFLIHSFHSDSSSTLESLNLPVYHHYLPTLCHVCPCWYNIVRLLFFNSRRMRNRMEWMKRTKPLKMMSVLFSPFIFLYPLLNNTIHSVTFSSLIHGQFILSLFHSFFAVALFSIKYMYDYMTTRTAAPTQTPFNIKSNEIEIRKFIGLNFFCLFLKVFLFL